MMSLLVCLTDRRGILRVNLALSYSRRRGPMLAGALPPLGTAAHGEAG